MGHLHSVLLIQVCHDPSVLDNVDLHVPSRFITNTSMITVCYSIPLLIGLVLLMSFVSTQKFLEQKLCPLNIF
jgi:hypothetical protein